MKSQPMNVCQSVIEKNKVNSEIRNSLKNDKGPSPKRTNKVKLTYATGSRRNNKDQFSFSLKLS